MKLEDLKQMIIGKIGNYYGALNVKVENGVPYWAIENYDGCDWQEITPELYLALLKFKGIKP